MKNDFSNSFFSACSGVYPAYAGILFLRQEKYEEIERN
jgi:hypothetical protein